MFSPQPKAATPGAPLPTPAGVSSRAGLFGASDLSHALFIVKLTSRA